MKEIQLNKEGYLQEVKEWTPEDITDFMSDFAGATDSNSAHIRAKEIALKRMNQGYSEDEAWEYAYGYEQALLDILNQR